MHDSLQYFTRRSAEGIVVPVIQAMVACYEKYHRACFLLPLLSLGSAVFVGCHNDILYATLLRVAELTVNLMKNGKPPYIHFCLSTIHSQDSLLQTPRTQGTACCCSCECFSSSINITCRLYRPRSCSLHSQWPYMRYYSIRFPPFFILTSPN